MQGFEIRVNGRRQNVAVRRGVVFIAVETTDISATGSDNITGMELDWGKTELSVGDRIRIAAREIDESDLPDRAKPMDRQRLLARYGELKKRLTEEGILPCGDSK